MHVMSDLPTYYLPGSHLSVKVINSDRSVSHLSFTASKAITPFTMSQVLVVQSRPGSDFVLKVYDPRFFCHRHDGKIKRPWSYDAEAGAATMRAQPNAHFDFVFPTELPDDDDLVGWEEWYYRHSDEAAASEIAAYTKLVSLQGKGVAKCYGSGALDLPCRVIAPRVLILELLPGAMTLKDVPCNLITNEVVESLISAVASFGPLGVTHCDLNVTNILFVPGPNGIVQRSVVVDFGSSFTHEDESEEKWERIVKQERDVRWLRVRLRSKLGREL